MHDRTQVNSRLR